MNRQRKKAEFARAYGSKERVEWVKGLPCLVCRRTPSENCHTRTGGVGRKADADTIVPLCHHHHAELHRDGRLSFIVAYGINLHAAARDVEHRWQALQSA